MKFDRKYMQLYAITDRKWVGRQTLYEQIEDALKGGITCLQLREKNISEEEFLNEAIEIHKLCTKYKVPLIINDNTDVAILSNAEGIHVGQGDMEVSEIRRKVGDRLIIGVSAHNVKEAVLAESQGADYLGVGAVFGTKTKSDASPISKSVVSEICKSVSIPIVAIGGIDENNILELSGTGIDGTAIISAIFSAENIEQRTRELFKLSKQVVSKSL